ncbi:MAG: dihydrodipicolinate synthase family protein [Pseudomonadales bacterium]|nr:dihydrodipicolinate synthase family protein [Pseudomonadales bacterium]
MSLPRFSGVLAPVITPFKDDLSPAAELLSKHCQWLLSQGAGLAVFGTNSEANSLNTNEKRQLLDSLCESGIDPNRLMPGTGACALTDAVELTAHAVQLGCAGVLMLPPFYYKGVPDEGLYAFYSEVIQRVASDRLHIYLYHIPPVAQVGINLPLIERLCSDYPETVVGIKDSSGDWEHTQQLNDLGIEDFRVFCGSETFLLQNMQAGGAGCISATANVNPAEIKGLFDHWQSADAEQRQQRLNQIRAIFQSYPMISALKAATGIYSGEPGWMRVRPPLLSLNDEQLQNLRAELEQADFQMPDI